MRFVDSEMFYRVIFLDIRLSLGWEQIKIININQDEIFVTSENSLL